MKNLKKIIASSLSVISLAISAQNVIPKMSIVRESNVTPIVLQDMHIDIYVVGQTAVTTMEMVFPVWIRIAARSLRGQGVEAAGLLDAERAHARAAQRGLIS